MIRRAIRFDWIGRAEYELHRILRRHEYCEPGCDTVAHCWRCCARMKQTPEWDAYWIDDDGITHSKATDALSVVSETHRTTEGE